MKKLLKSMFKNLLVIAVLFMGTILSVSANPAFKIVKDEAGKILKLKFEAKQASEFTVKIIDALEIVLHRESISTDKRMMKKYVLENLPKGDYTLIVEGQLSKVIQPLQITVSDLEIDASKRSEIFKPMVRLNENKLDIDLFTQAHSKVSLQLFDGNYESLFVQKYQNFGPVFGKRLDLSQLKKGKYILKLKTKHEVFVEVITLK